MDTKKLRQKILDLAIHGKLVPQDPNDEPASVLLERIRAEKERLIAEGKIKKPKAKKTSDTPHYEQDVPNGWCETALSEIITLLSGRDLQPTQYNSFEKGIPYITGASNIDNNTIIINRWTTAPITISHKGDLLITCKGTIGKLAFNSVGDLHIARQLMSLQFIEPLVSKYLFYCLEERICAIKQMDNGLIPGIDRSIILNQIIQLPPLAEQHRIVAEIESWFALIDIIEQSKEGLETAIKQAKNKILDLAIHGKLVQQNPNDEPASELLKRINPKAQITCDNRHYENIPSGWTTCKLEDIIDYEQPQEYIVKSTEYSDNYPIPVLTAGKSFVIGYTNETEGVFNRLPVIIFDDFTTDSKFVNFPFKVKSSAMKILHVKDGMNIKYVTHFMSITRLIGDTHKRYWISEYSKLLIPIPPLKEQDRIVERIDRLFNSLDEIANTLN